MHNAAAAHSRSSLSYLSHSAKRDRKTHVRSFNRKFHMNFARGVQQRRSRDSEQTSAMLVGWWVLRTLATLLTGKLTTPNQAPVEDASSKIFGFCHMSNLANSFHLGRGGRSRKAYEVRGLKTAQTKIEIKSCRTFPRRLCPSPTTLQTVDAARCVHISGRLDAEE